MRGILGTLLGGPIIRAEAGDVGTLTDRAFWSDFGPMTRAGRHVSTNGALQVSAAYACVNLLAKTVASVPLRMYRRDPVTKKSFEAPEHPLNELLEHQPNRWQTAWDFKAMLMMHLALRGRAFAEIVPGARGAVDQLEPLNPDLTVVERLPDRTLRYRTTDYHGQRKVLLQDEVLHLRSAMSLNGIDSVGPVTYARETLGLALAAEEHGARLFSNGARPSGVVTIPKAMSDPAFERFKKEWADMYVGLQNANKTPILEDGAKFEAISLTAEDAQFLSTRQFQIEEIARWFDVPLVMLHHMTNQTSWGTGVEAIMLAFVRNNLMPWLTCWTQAVRRDLILAPGLYEARFDVEELQRGDSAAQANFFARLVLGGILTRNEAREALGYNPLPGLDEPLTPTNTTTAQDSMKSPAPGESTGKSDLIGHNGGPALEGTENGATV